MNCVFHLFTVAPVDVEVHQQPRVQYSDYFVLADGLQEAVEQIRAYPTVAEACEVWGAPYEHAVIIDPLTRLHRQEAASLHLHWTMLQHDGPYRMVLEGADSLQQWAERRFEAYCRSKYAVPQPTIHK